MTNVSILTTQNVSVHYRIAGLGDRFLAFLLDMLIKVVYGVAINLIFARLHISFSPYTPMAVILFYLPFAFYSLVTEFFLNGQTFGKMVLKIKVIKLDGSRPGLGSYIIRWILRLLDTTFFIGMIAIAVSEKGQRVGDMLAGTTVIKLKTAQTYMEALPDIPDEYYIVFPQVGNLSDKDINIIKDSFDNAEQVRNYELLRSLANKIKQVLNIDTTMQDEDFIRTIIKDYFYYHSDPSNSFAEKISNH